MARRKTKKKEPDKGPDRCHDRALGLLAVRWRTYREMRERLTRAGFDPEMVEAEILRLEAAELLDDERFARDYVREAVKFKGAGGRAVASALYGKGVPREIIDRHLAALADSEEPRAEALARRRLARFGDLEPATAHRRLAGFLARKGYDPGVVFSVTSRVLSESHRA